MRRKLSNKREVKSFLVQLDKDLYRRLKIVGANTDRPMVEIVSRALEGYLGRAEERLKKKKGEK